MEDLSKRLREILDEQNLSIYGAAQIVGAETDEPLKTVHQRLSSWLNRPPKSWVDIQTALESLGYQVEVNKIKTESSYSAKTPE